MYHEQRLGISELAASIASSYLQSKTGGKSTPTEAISGRNPGTNAPITPASPGYGGGSIQVSPVFQPVISPQISPIMQFTPYATGDVVATTTQVAPVSQRAAPAQVAPGTPGLLPVSPYQTPPSLTLPGNVPTVDKDPFSSFDIDRYIPKTGFFEPESEKIRARGADLGRFVPWAIGGVIALAAIGAFAGQRRKRAA